MNTNVRLFDHDNKLVPNFNEEIEKILISIHGENYYDIDEELENTNLIPTSNNKDSEYYKDEELEKTMEIATNSINSKEVKIVEKDDSKTSIKDFVPVIFFILIFTIIVIAGYYFLNTVDLMSLFGME